MKRKSPKKSRVSISSKNPAPSSPNMRRYGNSSGKSNVVSYEIDEMSIHVVFAAGSQRNYLYDYSSPGKAIVDRMKVLAVSGKGLNTYITKIVKGNFARQW